jgi:deoxycytidine triphosphate deaminase
MYQGGRRPSAWCRSAPRATDYDIRCSEEFKLFTDINSTIVDPKNFDPKSFVDVQGIAPAYIPPTPLRWPVTVDTSAFRATC